MPRNTLIQCRNGTYSAWDSQNSIVLASGEPGYVTDFNKLKIGDGSTQWSDLTAVNDNLTTMVINKTASTIPKMSVVYINGAQGDTPSITLSLASGESSSSKTYGITVGAIAPDAVGQVVVDGALKNLNTLTQFNGVAPGTTLWLSPTVSGGITTTKPYAPYHMVAVGNLIRVHQTQGVINVKIQNGFELEELHNVAVTGATNGQFLQYNSASGLWIPSSSGNFTTLLVNGTGVSVNGHTHSSSDITDFNSSVSGLLPTIANSGDNRVLTSTGSSVGINAETNLTFNGSLLNVTGSGSFSNNITASGFVRSGGTSSQFLKADGGVDSTSYQPLLTNPVTGTGIVNHIPYWNSSSGIVADSGQLIWDATNNRLGIGTSSPSGTLDIIGNTHTRGISYFHMNDGVTDTTSSIQRLASNELRMTSLGQLLRLIGDAGKCVLQSFVATEIGSFGYIMFYPGITERARLTADGDFGIGTSAPSARLHVVGTGIFSGDVRTSGSFIASSGSAAAPSFEFINDADTGMFNPSANVIALSTSGVERLRIDNIGRIGIGISSPSGQLHVNGTGIFSSGLAVNTTNFNFYTAQNDIKTSAASISGSVWIQNDLNFYTPNETNAYQRGQITSNGDAIFNTLGVGEKQDSPGNSVTMDTNGLIVNNAGGTGGSACQLLGDYGAIIENTLVVNNNSAGSAKVGIGTSTPTHSLDVDGNIRSRKLYLESVSSPSIVSSGLTLNLANSQLFTVNLNSNITTVTISNTPSTSGVAVGFSLIFTADGTARSVTWPSGIKWAGGTSPALTSTSGKIDVLSFISTNSGTHWLGFVGGQNY